MIEYNPQENQPHPREEVRLNAYYIHIPSGGVYQVNEKVDRVDNYEETGEIAGVTVVYTQLTQGEKFGHGKVWARQEENFQANFQRLIKIYSPKGGLSLKQFSLLDVAEMYNLINRNRKFVDQYDNDTSTKYPDLDAAIERTIHPPNPKRLRFGIRVYGGKLVGSINLTPDENNPAKGEIGYYLGEEFTGHGYATEAVGVLSDFAFSHGYNHLWAHVDPNNIPSQKVLERAGFVLTEEKTAKGNFIYSQII